MIKFMWVGMFLLFPLPWCVRRFLPPALPASSSALRVPFLEELEALSDDARTIQSANKIRFSLAIAVWGLLVTASARPIWLGEPIEQAISGRDMLLAIDLSESMDTPDFLLRNKTVNRLTASKSVAGEFIERRVGDRLGLILFGEQAYLQSPLTFDRKTVRTLLEEAVIGLAGGKTAIGDAIGLAIKRLKNNPAHQRVLILLSDGANTTGEIEPLQAATLAQKAGLKIYTIGMGADTMVVQDLFGRRIINPSQDLDEHTMRSIAEKTGGRYFRARDTDELEEIYRLLDMLEPIERDKRTYRPRTELYVWPLGIAFFLSIWLVFSRKVA